MMTAASALDLGRQIAAGERDPVDVAEHYLGEALGDTNAACIQVTTERALGEARQSASRTRSGQGRGRRGGTLRNRHRHLRLGPRTRRVHGTSRIQADPRPLQPPGRHAAGSHPRQRRDPHPDRT